MGHGHVYPNLHDEQWRHLGNLGTTLAWSLDSRLNDFDRLWQWEWTTSGVIGYAETFDGTATMTSNAGEIQFPTNVNKKLTAATVQYYTASLPIRAATRVLTACASLCDTDGPTLREQMARPPPIGGPSSSASALSDFQTKYNWTSIKGSYPTGSRSRSFE